MLTFEEYLQKEKDMKEDEMVAAAPSPSSDIVAAPTGIKADDILGKCDHSKHGGFMSKDCNHIPKPLSLEPMRRTKKLKKQKFYIVSDAELPEISKKALSKISEDKIMQFISDYFNISYYDLYQIDDIAYVSEISTFYIKFQIMTKNSFIVRFVEAKFNGKKFLPINNKIMTAKQSKLEFKEKYPKLNSKKFILCWH